MAYRRTAIIYSLFVGILMILMWTFFLSSGLVPELSTEPARIIFHIAGELATAALLIIGGISLIGKNRWVLHIHKISLGLLLYTLIVSPDYYAQLGQYLFVVMFSVLIIATVVVAVFSFVKQNYFTE